MYGCGPGLIFVPLCFDSSAPHYVNVTWPDGEVETFDLTPARGSTFLSGLTSARFTGRPRTTSTLEAVDAGLYFSNGDLLGGFFGCDGIYDPTRFRLTDRSGTQYLLEVGRGLISATDRNGNTVTVSDAGIQSSLGPSITFVRDGSGRITTMTGPSGETHTYTYLPSGDLGTVTDATDHTVEYHYNAAHDLTQIENATGTPFRTITYEDGRITSITDGENHTTLVDIDVDARQEIVTTPSGRLTTISTYDERGNAVTVQEVFDGTTRTTAYEYDDLGRLEKRTDPLDHETHLTYDADGNPDTITDALERTTTLRYEQGSLIQILGPDGVATLTIDPDDAGNPEVVDLGLGFRSTFTFNDAGKPLTATQPLDKTYTSTYHPSGALATIDDPLDNTVGVTWNDSQKPLTITTPTGSSGFTYDGNGNIRTVVDGRGGTWTYTYDEQHRLLTERDPLLRTRTRTYDDAGRLESILDRNGDLTEYHYDEDGLLTSIDVPDGSTIEYSYDGLGRQITAENGTAHVRLTYDATNLVRQVETTPVGGSGIPATTVSYTYDEVGNRRTMTTSEGVTQYRYDDFDRLDQITEPDGDVITLDHDRLGRIDRLTRPNGVSSDWTWNAASQATAIVHDRAGSTIDQVGYDYGDSGLLDELTDVAGVHGFGYDDAGQLESVDHPAGRTDEAYAYDPAGNRTTNGSLHDAGNRITQNGGHTFTWDNEGRIGTKTDRSTGAVTTYDWDGEGRLLSVTTGGATTTFGYDPLGRRISVTGPSGTRFLAYGLDPSPVAELDAGGALNATFLFGSALDTPLAMTRGADTYYFLQDAGRNVTALTDDAGAIVARYSYDAFGAPVAATGTVPNPFTFAAREYEPAASAYYLRLRWYDPGLGRFLSEDPIPAPNLYPFANNNPLTFADPMGAQAMTEYSALQRKNAQQAARQRNIYRFYDCGDEALGRASGWYYGMTTNVARRQAQHGSRALEGSWETLITGDMGWMVTRAIEQAFIDVAGLGNLANQINSMSSTNPNNAKWLPQGKSYIQNFITDPNFNFNPAAPGGC
jgi:RHS repeat-associated protein